MNTSLENKLIVNYWINKLKLCPLVNDSPLTLLETEKITIKKETLSYFNKLSANNEVVEFTVLLSIYNILLERYFETAHFIASSGLAKNEHSLLYKFNSIEEATFKEYLNKVKEEVQEVFKYSNFNESLIGKTSFYNYTSFGFSYNSNFHNKKGDFPFYLKINKEEEEEEEGLTISISYDENFTTAYVANHFLRNINSWLLNLESYIGEKVDKLPIISEQEREETLYSFNNTKADYPKDKTIVDLFEEQVVKTPNNIAIVFENKQLTYAELESLSNQLAHHLVENHKVKPKDLIGIKLERSEWVIISILGVLKAGAVYVPIDAQYPENRVSFIRKDSNCKSFIDGNFISSFKKESHPKNKLNINISPSELAYVIYTSGSTGKPKGVTIMHYNVVRLFFNEKSLFDFNSSDVWYLFHSYAFDFSVWEIFGALLFGGKLVIPTQFQIKDAVLFSKLLLEHNVTILNQTPSSFQSLNENLLHFGRDYKIRYLIFGGEPLYPSFLKKWKKEYSQCKLINMYGITEITVHATYKEITDYEIELNISNIGRPIPTLRCYILNELQQPQPKEVIGELYVSGAGVARGYLNNPELTAERFIANPFKEGEIMYKTGDLARWLPDGNIEFLGRKDTQVKIRGYRIELEEIENTIVQFSDTIQQVVLNVKESENEKELVAYYVSKSEIEKSELRDFLQERLPSYMVPSYYMVLNTIPLTPNGKIDKKSLPKITSESLIRKEYVAPRNEIEKQLVEIWQEVISLGRIGVTDNFFELGGHSLLVGQVINRIYKQLNRTITFKSFFENPIIEALSKELSNSTYNAIPQIATKPYYSLTTSQHRIWVLSQLEGGNLAYNMPGAVTLKGNLDVLKFEEIFKRLIKRHEILRTNFKVNESGEIHQYITREDAFEFNLLEKEVTNHTKEEIGQLLEEEHATAFDLANGLLLRAMLLKTLDNEYIFSLTIHHIIGDGWSMELLISEVISTYNNLVQNKEYNLPKLEIQYKDYAVWLKSELSKEHYKTSETYWLSQFQGELPILDLPSFKNRPKIQTYNGKTLTHSFSIFFLEKLKAFSISKDATLFMVLMSGINTLLYRYTNQNDIIVGTPIAGRKHPDLEGQIGLYLNTLAIRTKIEESDSFLDVLDGQKQTLLSAYEYQNYPFDELVNKLNLQRDTSRSVLFDVMVVLQNQTQLQNIKTDNNLEGIKVEDYEINRNTSQFDISFTFLEKEGLELSIEYNTDIYDDLLMERMFTHYENLMSQAIDNPNDPILSIEYITEKEKKQLLEEFNNTKVDYPKDKTIVDLFEKQVKKIPNNVAIVFEDKKLTYTELNEQSNQLAQYLRETFTIQSDDLIGIKLERSEQLLIAIFGIIKSGAAYVPIDINYPQERINYIEKDSNCKIVIDKEMLENFNTIKGKYSIENLKNITKPNHLVYVIYTSGTTGTPKGVMVEHRNVVSIYSDWKKQYELDQFVISLLQLASVSFDVFVGDICRSLLNGGKMVLPSDNTKLNPKDLYDLMEKHQISLFEGTPGLILPLLNYIKENNKDYSFLKLVIFGSDSFNNQTFNGIQDTFGNSIKIINSYGLTETTIDSSYYDGYNSTFLGTTPIGKPFSNTKIFILNENQELVPTGVFGTIFIGGAGVSRGYYNKAALTTSKFIRIAYQNENVYSTGDLARWLPDGNIEFLGRNDHQVKLRGYRIELGEIETIIRQYSEEIENVVVAVKEINQEKVLISYYISTSVVGKSNLKKFLQKKLPEYMIPDFYIQLDSFVLTSNGKINQNALPNISGEDSVRKTYIAPKGKIEKELVAIWEEVIGIKKIGITDNFFELGGHSLKITKLRNLVNKKFDVTISFNDFFMESTIENQSKLIKESSKSIYQNIPKLSKQDSYVLSSSQRRIWILSQFEGGNTAYNMPGVFLLKGTIDIKVMEKAFHSLIERHEALRTRFKEDTSTGEIRQIIYSSEENDFEFVYDGINFLNRSKDDLKQIIETESNYNFDLSNESLLRAKIIKTGNKKAFLIFVIHHIISDGWSLEIITNELFLFYNAYLNNEKSTLQPLTIQYKEYASWEQDQLSLDKTKESKKYWENQFQEEVPILELPTNKKRPLYKMYIGKSVTQKLSKDILKQFKLLCQSNNSTLFMGLIAVIKYLLYKYSNQKDIIIGTPIAGREHTLLQNQIGVYINTLALRTKFKGDDSFETLLKKVKKTTLAAYEHQLYPFDKLVSDLPLQRDLSRNPLFDVMVTLQNTDNSTTNINTIKGLRINEYVSSDTVMSKFDLEFIFEEKNDELEINLLYNSDIFEATFIEDLQMHLNIGIESCIKKPKESLYKLSFLTSKEETQLIYEFNDTVQKYNKEKTFLDLFKEQVITQPNAVAVIDEVQQYSYKELDILSAQIAEYLNVNFENKRGAFGVMLDRSVITIALLLGILKSGRVYIPLDPTFPVDRLKYIINHSGIKVLISSEELSEITTDKIITITATEILTKITNLEGNIDSTPIGSDTAYIIYTSGSTGNPKGVEIEHRSLLNFLLSINKEPRIENTDTLFAVTTYSFDISILEFFTPLIAGASAYIVSNETLADPEKTIRLLESVKPTIIQATPSFYQQLFNTGWKGNKQLKILCGGDALSESLADQLLESSLELWNMYGPTETTIWSTIKKIKKSDQANIIGKPIANTSLYVLGEFLQLQAKGTVGNLFIGGDGLAKGYYKQNKLTEQRFIKNPFESGFIYETGDVVKWNEHGELVFLGRNDNQVKIRGYRVELGDIEAKMNVIQTIEKTIVVAKKDPSGDSILIAYFISKKNLKIDNLRSQLKEVLPYYMIPSRFIRLDAFPLTPNKKINRKALVNLDNVNLTSSIVFIPANTEVEKKLVLLWKDLLGIGQIGIKDNFFDLGGHSLSTTKLVGLIQKEFSVKLTINKIFEHADLESMANYIDNILLVQINQEQPEIEIEFDSFSI